MMMKESTTVLLVCLFVAMTAANPLKRWIPNCHSSYVEMSGCSKWRQLCRVSSYKVFMNKNCKDTCGICKAAPPPFSTSTKISFDVSKCLAASNFYRYKHGAPGLQWDDTLASGSADWALHLAKILSMQHSPGSFQGLYGENVYYSATSAIGTLASCKDAVKSWYSEIKDYDYNNPGFAKNTGHFTQVVWKSTTKVGVGIAAVTKGGFTYTYVVARYTPAGNLLGAFAENVLPSSKK